MGKHDSESSKAVSSGKKDTKKDDEKSKDSKSKDDKKSKTAAKAGNTSDGDEPKKSKREINASKRTEKNHNVAKDRRSKIDKIARLHVPANKIKKNMLAYWKIDNEDPPSLRDQVHIAVASIIEDMTIMTLKTAMPYSKKNNFGRRTVSDRNIVTAIDENQLLRKLFKVAMESYNADHNYIENSILNGDELNYTLSSLDDVYQFGEKALNMMCYIINSFFNDHIMAGLKAVKKNMEPKGMSIKNRMLNTVLDLHINRTILKPMKNKAMECVRKVEEYNHQNREEAEQKRIDSEEIADDSDDESSKKSSKKSGKGSKKEESGSDDEDDKKSSKKSGKGSKSSKKEESDSDDEGDNKKSSKKSAKGAKKQVDESEDDDEAEESDDESDKKSKNSKKGKHSSSSN
jgi:hypothetical protein